MPVKAALGIAALLPLARLALFRGPMAKPVSPPPTGLLDMHCHTAGIGHCGSGAWVSDSLRNSWKFPLYLRIFESSLDDVLTCFLF